MDNELIKSFKIQDDLNPKVWEKDSDDYVMKSEVRERLLEIAYQFIDFLGVDIVVTDIILTGSLSNYNWSKYSDFDLHVVADFNQYPENQIELYEKLFNLKKMIFNQNHDITLFNYEVELYVQNETESHFSSGVYSVLFNEWSNEPKKEDVSIDKELLKQKYSREIGKNYNENVNPNFQFYDENQENFMNPKIKIDNNVVTNKKSTSFTPPSSVDFSDF